MHRHEGMEGDPSDAILVTGGSGFIGKHLVKHLSTSGKTVVSMYHHRLPDPMAGVYPVCSDLGSVELLAAPLRGVHTVFHLAWENNIVGSHEQVQWSYPLERVSHNIQMLSNLLRAMEKAGTRRVVFLSALGASRSAKTAFLREKYVAEHLVLNSSIPEKVVVRSGVVCGGGGQSDMFLRTIVNLMKLPGVYPVPTTEAVVSPLHIRDLTKILCDVESYELDGQSAVVEVAGQEQFRIDELFRMVSDRFVKGARFQLRGVLGNSLLPFLEKRSSKNPAQGPRIRDYLSLSGQLDQNVEKDNPLQKVIPQKLSSFKEVLAENQSL